MKNDDINGVLEFLKGAERLKDVLRSAHTATGKQESTAEHTWRLCLWVLVLAERFDGIDAAKLMRMCVVHDLGEALNGDIPAIVQHDRAAKTAQERADLKKLVAPLPRHLQAEIVSLWEEYEAASSPEARLAKGLDKLETILQHNQGLNPDDFDYAFNLTYGAEQTAADPLLNEIRGILDVETRARAAGARGPSSSSDG